MTREGFNITCVILLDPLMMPINTLNDSFPISSSMRSPPFPVRRPWQVPLGPCEALDGKRGGVHTRGMGKKLDGFSCPLDVTILQDQERPGILNTRTDVFRMALATPDATFWAGQKEQKR